MSYTREPIVSESTPAAPVNQPAVMREEAVYDPYARSVPRPGVDPALSGQPGKGGNSAEVPAAPEESVKLSPQVAALARKEQLFRKQQQEFKAREAALEAKAAKLAKYEAMDAKLAKKDYSALDEVGVDYNEYSQHQVNRLNSEDPQQKALKTLSDKVESVEKAYKDNLNKQYEAAVNERKLAAKQLVESSADKFPRIKRLGQEDTITQHLLDTWENDGIELTVEQAAQEVEQELTDRAKRWASALAEESAPEPEKKNLPPMKQGLRTITNQVTAGEVKRLGKSFQNMTDGERWAEARRRAEEKLKQG